MIKQRRRHGGRIPPESRLPTKGWHARRLNRATSAGAAGNAGTAALNVLYTENTKSWHISGNIQSTTRRCVSSKLQAPSLKPKKAPSGKPQAPSTKLQAASRKRQAPWSAIHETFDNDPRLGDQGPRPGYNYCSDVAHAMQFGVEKIGFFYPSLLLVQLWKMFQIYYIPTDQAYQEC